jgi:hypothetical protein
MPFKFGELFDGGRPIVTKPVSMRRRGEEMTVVSGRRATPRTGRQNWVLDVRNPARKGEMNVLPATKREHTIRLVPCSHGS